ncbi:ABC transporter ATP-binding protein [Vagococcus elongatus]|uniref:Bacitracin ABC transporter ATP-binding protein n=1 Tax=Vagococcus elongatus TaxID=180344 RepID=A0A430B281_9ENTE|nr:ABC transporter ATP-binding protein [Vagococcus elongatus]RSU14361.1 bacitracin ABC transporter ATP-binding protein [Vagococcus elongatus]
MVYLELKNVTKTYSGVVPYEAIRRVNLKVPKGEFVSIMGPSGSGKTTLLNLIATLDRPTNGSIFLNQKEPHQLKKDEMAKFRRRELGFVFQEANLLKTLSVRENIMLPLTLDKVPVAEMKEKAEALMEAVAITPLADKRIYEISGGEAQRVAIARALIHEPSLILADEPTGNLDSQAAGNVMKLLAQMNREKEVTTLMVTHDAVSASYSHRVIFIKDGQLYNEIYCGESRKIFFQSIMDVLAHLGGVNHEFQAPPVFQ